jgi:hypothetical protein
MANTLIAETLSETTLLSLFEDIPQASAALSRLRGSGDGEAGRGSQDLMVISSVPFPEGVLEADKSPVRLPLITFAGALVGICTGILFADLTAQLYVLRTGGKPIISWPPVGIICYEFMMLTALVFCFLGAFYEMRLPNWKAKVYDPRISEGLIGIAVYCTSEEQVTQADAICRDEGAVDVRRDAREFE